MRPILALVITVAAALAFGACGSYEPACRLEQVTTVMGELGASPELFPAGDGEVVVTWFEERAMGASGDIGARPVPTAVVVARVDPQGREIGRHTFALASDVIDQSAAGTAIVTAWTGEGVALAWIEHTPVLDELGKEHRQSALRMAFVSLGGSEHRIDSPVDAVCRDCDLRVSMVTTPGGASLLYARTPSAFVDPDRAISPVAGFVQIKRYGAREEADLLPWVTQTLDGVRPNTPSASGQLGGQPPASLGLPRVERLDTALLVRTSMGLWVTGSDFEQLAGPYAPPDLNRAKVDWDPEAQEATVSYAASAGKVQVPDSSDPSSAIALETNIFIQRFARSGQLVSRRERVTKGGAPSAQERSGDRVAITFNADGHRYLAYVDEDGAKIGGDMDLGRQTAQPTGRTAQGSFGAASLAPRTTELLRSPEPGRFVDLVVDGATLKREELVCAR